MHTERAPVTVDRDQRGSRKTPEGTPRLRDAEGDMKSLPQITEIDISRQARALAWLRLTDYALVMLCGSWAIGLLAEMVDDFLSANAGPLVVKGVTLAILCFAAYTGWRHVGVIDSAVWRAYLVVFPMLLVFCLFIVMGVFGTQRSRADFESQVRNDMWLLFAVLIGSVILPAWISLMRLRRTNIPVINATIGQMVRRLTKNAGVRAVEAADIRRINKPRGLFFGAAGVVVLFSHNWMKGSPVAYFVVGFFLLLRARRYFQIDADSLLAVDQRPPILFLRSFDDDEKPRSRPDRALLDFSLETRLSNHFSRFGPFVAIGSPKETMPQLGAARVLLSDEEWQPRVLRWMRDAKLIIMYSGKTHWVNWELRQLVENECATRLILMIPEIKGWRRSKRNEEILARVEQMREVFKGTPWEEELLQFDDFAGLRAMLFRPDGSMVMVKSRSRRRDSYHLAALVAHSILINSDALNHEAEDTQTVA